MVFAVSLEEQTQGALEVRAAVDGGDHARCHVRLPSPWRVDSSDGRQMVLSVGALDSSEVRAVTSGLKSSECLGKCPTGFAVIRVSEESVDVWTDRFGTVPLYYAIGPQLLKLADAVNPLLDGVWEWDRQAVLERLVFDYCIAGRTLFRGVWRVPPGSHAIFRIGTAPTFSTCFSYALPSRPAWAVHEGADRLRATVVAALGTRDSVVCYLSGGLDSRLVAGIARRYWGGQVLYRTFGAARCLDVQLARRVGRKLGADHEVAVRAPGAIGGDFETAVVETAGELNGVHAHDVQAWRAFGARGVARLSGFIGDLLARGGALRVRAGHSPESWRLLAKKHGQIDEAAWGQVLEDGEAAANGVRDALANQAGRSQSESGPESLRWDFYCRGHVFGLTSLLEAYASAGGPRPLLPFQVETFWPGIVASTERDLWSGMYWAEVGKALLPDLLRIPLASNSVFRSRRDEIWFRARRRLHGGVGRLVGRATRGSVGLAPFNATLPWNLLLNRELASWLDRHLAVAVEELGLRRCLIEGWVLDHRLGRRDRTQLLLRAASLGVLAEARRKGWPSPGQVDAGI